MAHTRAALSIARAVPARKEPLNDQSNRALDSDTDLEEVRFEAGNH